MHYRVEIETRDCGDECPGHFEASVIRGPSWTRPGWSMAVSREEALEETVRYIRRTHISHSFDFIHTPA